MPGVIVREWSARSFWVRWEVLGSVGDTVSVATTQRCLRSRKAGRWVAGRWRVGVDVFWDTLFAEAGRGPDAAWKQNCPKGATCMGLLDGPQDP